MIKFETAIVSADIYYSGAEIIRRGTAELAEGTQTIHITGLTGSLDQNTVRLFSSAGVKCFNQRFETPDPEDAENESRKIQKEIDGLTRQADIRRKQIGLWEKNGDFTARSSLEAEEIAAYIDRLPERIGSLESEIEALEEKLRKRKKELEETVWKEQQPVFAADISVESAGTYPFELRYFESNARWSPVYEIWSDAAEALDVRMRAKIAQYTREDWKDISLRLYSGNPTSGGTLPKLAPVYLSFQNDPIPRSNARMMMPMSASKSRSFNDEEACEDTVGGLFAEAATMGMALADTRMETMGASVNAEETMTEYILPGKWTIEKETDGTMADLTRYAVPAEYRIAAAAGADPHAYLIAKVKPADLPFTESFTASVYLRDRYAGQVYLSPELTEETIEITLGEEERIHVSRKEVSRKQSSVLLKGQKALDCTFETKVTNLSGDKTVVELRDQIPVSRVNEITVEPKNISGAAHDSKTGILTKEFTVLPDVTETFTVSYRITWPKDKRYYESKGMKFCPMCGYRTNNPFCPQCGSRVN